MTLQERLEAVAKHERTIEHMKTCRSCQELVLGYAIGSATAVLPRIAAAGIPPEIVSLVRAMMLAQAFGMVMLGLPAKESLDGVPVPMPKEVRAFVSLCERNLERLARRREAGAGSGEEAQQT